MKKAVAVVMVVLWLWLWLGVGRAGAAEDGPVHFEDKEEEHQLAQIMSDMGFSTVAMHLMASPHLLLGRRGSLTLFAPTEGAFLNVSDAQRRGFSLSHHIAEGVYSYSHLQALQEGASLNAVAPGADILVTFDDFYAEESSSPSSDASHATPPTPPVLLARRVYVNGALVAHPDLFNDGILAIHGVDQLLDVSFHEAVMTTSSSLSYATAAAEAESARSVADATTSPGGVIMPFMLRDAEASLRDRGFSILALAMRLKAGELLRLHNFTVFALSDDSIFLPFGPDFVSNVRYHVVPDSLLSFPVLARLRPGTRLPTLLHPRWLLVTNTLPLSINHVAIKTPDVYVNRWMVVHEISVPFWHPVSFFPSFSDPEFRV